MSRWLLKRWVWATIVGATVTIGFAAGRGDGPPHKVGDVIPLKFQGMPEREVKVLKIEKQPDGTYHSEVKDTKTGETFTLVDRVDDVPPKNAEQPKAKESSPPKAKTRPNDPLLPPVAATMPDASKDKEKEKSKRPILDRIFGDKDKDKDKTPATTGTPGTVANSSPKPDAADSGKKPGLIGRIFGPKKPTGPSMPASTNTNTKPATPATPPPILPTPPGGLNKGTTAPAFPGSTAEPPRVMPAKPMPSAPPTFVPPSAPPATSPVAPVVPVPVPPATTPSVPLPLPQPPASTLPPPPALPLPPMLPAPATPSPALPPVPAPPANTAPALPTPLPALPSPTPAPTPAPLPIPPLPAPPAGSGLPPLPIPPGGMSYAKPAQPVMPASYIPLPPSGTATSKPLQVNLPSGYVPPQIAFDRDVQPFVIALQTMNAPSARLTAARGLAEGRHASTDGVKSVLYQAALQDPCGEVRAACIDHLCKLGYFTPHFLDHIQRACEDNDPVVREAAKAACAKMIRK